MLSLPKSYTTTYGLHSFKYQAVKYWNSLLDNCRQTVDFNDFRKNIKNYQFSYNYLLTGRCNVYLICTM